MNKHTYLGHEQSARTLHLTSAVPQIQHQIGAGQCSLAGGRTHRRLRQNYDKREVPSADASAEEHTRYAVNKITEMASV